MGLLNEVFGFTNDWVKDNLKSIKSKPSRLITGVDPISTQMWNKIKGSDDKALVNVYGGPTEEIKDKYGATEGTRNWYQVADTVASMWGMKGAAGGISKGLGVSAGTAGKGLGQAKGLVGDEGFSAEGAKSTIGGLTGSGDAAGQGSSGEAPAESSILGKYIKESLLNMQQYSGQTNSGYEQFDIVGKEQQNGS